MRISSILMVGLLLLGILACRNEPKPETVVNAEGPYVRVEGKTMGTYYRVQYQDQAGRDFKKSIDSLLVALNLEVSTYIDTSTISRFNQAADGLSFEENIETALQQQQAQAHFINNFILAQSIYQSTNGAFDPTVMPLVNYWGFGYEAKKPVTAVDSAKIRTLMRLVGLEKVTASGNNLKKQAAGVQLDFSGIAKGYGVDLVADFLRAKGATNLLVDIGGEVVALGTNQRGEAWQIGINTPLETAELTDYEVIVELRDQGLATSGNYRNYYEVNGKKYAHTINPKTGFPERSTLLSASVFAPTCAIADGYATAFMVMGLEAAYATALELPAIEACFIYSREDGSLDVKVTPGLEGLFTRTEESINQ